MKISRVWSMPSRWTFQIPPIRDLVARYVGDGKGWIDPFAGMNCLGASQKILTADLRWVRVGDLRKDDRLLGFTKEGSERSIILQESVVLSNNVVNRDAERIIFDNREPIIATLEHPFLRKRGAKWYWATVNQLKTSITTGRGHTKQNNYKLSLPQPFNVWEDRRDWEAGWLSGFYDGEGSIDFGLRREAGYYNYRVNSAQAPGQTEELLEKLLFKNGFSFSKELDKDGNVKIRHKGGVVAQLEFLGSIRPQRLLSKIDFVNKKIGLRFMPITSPQIVGIETVFNQEIATLSTSTGTYIGEGFLCHNSPAEFTNDIERDDTTFKMDALEFLKRMGGCPTAGTFNGVLFDPPYSVEQCLRRYTPKFKGTAGRAEYWAKCKDQIARIVKQGGIVITFCWDSTGIGEARGFKIEEIMLICHGACHNDTIVTVERKVQGDLESLQSIPDIDSYSSWVNSNGTPWVTGEKR